MKNRVQQSEVKYALDKLLNEIRYRAESDSLPWPVQRCFDEYDKIQLRYDAQNTTIDMFKKEKSQ